MFLGGCGRWLVTSDFRPPSNPLLDGPTPTTAPGPYTVRAPRSTGEAPAPVARSAPTSPTKSGPTGAVSEAPAEPLAELSADLPADRQAVVRALEAVVGQRLLDGRPATDLALVRAAYAPLGGPLAQADRVEAVPEQSARLLEPAQPGDLLLFEASAEVPTVCVVRRRLAEGVVEAGCVTRKAVRWVRVAPTRPGVRRSGDTILNTFLRPRRAEDPAGTGYLAGQLLRETRTPFR